jgi:hypothetical protein
MEKVADVDRRALLKNNASLAININIIISIDRDCQVFSDFFCCGQFVRFS